MRVKIEVTLDIDPEAWTLAYGVSGAQEIREDVRAYALNGVVEHFREQGLLVEEGQK